MVCALRLGRGALCAPLRRLRRRLRRFFAQARRARRAALRARSAPRARPPAACPLAPGARRSVLRAASLRSAVALRLRSFAPPLAPTGALGSLRSARPASGAVLAPLRRLRRRPSPRRGGGGAPPPRAPRLRRGSVAPLRRRGRGPPSAGLFTRPAPGGFSRFARFFALRAFCASRLLPAPRALPLPRPRALRRSFLRAAPAARRICKQKEGNTPPPTRLKP